ncbi:MAG: hypothetical protein JO100_06980 [Pseudonocardia sp.]|nr:hypothetical protein [Pseudonocardia sp.]
MTVLILARDIDAQVDRVVEELCARSVPVFRTGRSAYRALYRRVGGVFVIGAIGPEAQTDKEGFGRTVAAARARLDLIEEDLT